MAMTKKDYIAIADIFHQHMVEVPDAMHFDHACSLGECNATVGAFQNEPNSFHILNDLMQYMKQDNPRFNKTKFLEKVAAPHG